MPRSAHVAQEDHDVNGIIYADMKLPSNLYRDEDIVAACVECLMTKIDDVSVSRVHEPMRWGNSAGLSVLEQQDDMIRRIRGLGKTITSL